VILSDTILPSEREPTFSNPAKARYCHEPGTHMCGLQSLSFWAVGSIPTRLTSLINTAPGGFTLHPPLGAISLCHISRGASRLI